MNLKYLDLIKNDVHTPRKQFIFKFIDPGAPNLRFLNRRLC